jgi:hypothetical protein
MTRPTLDYQHTPAPAGGPPRPGPLGPLLLCLPGILCWTVYVAIVAGVELPVPVGVGGLAVFWFVAVVNVFVSFLIYGRSPFDVRPWYVLLCLALNIGGLLFSSCILPGLLV